MKKIIITLYAVSIVCTSLYAERATKIDTVSDKYNPIAIEKFYAGFGLSMGGVSSQHYSSDAVAGITGRVGYNFSKYLGLELRGTKGLNNGDQLSYDYSLGFYIKPQFSLSDELYVSNDLSVNSDISLYALLGYAQSQITLNNEVSNNSTTNDYTNQSGFSFGVGGEYKLNQKWRLFMDITRYVNKSTTLPEGQFSIQVYDVTFGIVYEF